MRKNKFKASALILALSAGAIAPGISAVMPTVAHAASASIADHKTSVVLHKYYNDDKDYTIKGDEIQNPRGAADFKAPDDLKAYGKEAQEKYGQLGFTIYKLTDAEGNSPKIANFNEEGTATVNEDNTKAKVNGVTYTLTAVGKEQELDQNGQVIFEGQDNGSYVIVETSRPKTYVQNRSQDLFFSLPLANATGNGFLDEIHVAPKNEVTQQDFIFTKYLNGDGEDQVLAGVTFQLYKGKPGSGKPIGDPQVTGADGKITLESLPLGDYYLVETAIPDAVEGSDYKLYVSPFAKDDSNNRLTFTIAGDTAVENYNAEFINYERPDADKKVNDGRHEDATERNKDGEHVSKGNHRHNFNKGDAVPFLGTIDVPYDVMGGTSIEVNGEERFSQPAGRLIFKDTPGKKLEIASGEGTLSERLGLELQATAPGGKSVTLEEGTDYTLTEDKDNGGFNINFITRDYNFKAYEGAESQSLKTVSEKVAAAAGGTVTISYNMNLAQTALPDEIIENDMEYIYNNSPGLEEDLDYVVKDKDNVETYGKKFLKTGTKNLGLAEDENTTIKGAKFYVYRTVDGYDVKNQKENVDLDGRQYLLADDNGNQSWSKIVKEANGEFEVPEGALELVSGADGSFEVKGLEKGSYYLEEFFAPEGWQINDKDQEFVVGVGTYEGEGAVVDHFVNRKDTDLPFTGTQFIAIGIAGVVIAAGTAIASKNKKEETIEVK